MSPSNLLEWSEFPIVDLLNESFRRTSQIGKTIQNAAAIGEYIYGAGRGHRNIFYLTVSTGIGGGLIIDGALYHGISTAAGEMVTRSSSPTVSGAIAVPGCLETICAGVHIARRARGEIGEW
jgi:glucokinase